MSRPLRIEIPNGVCHVTNRGLEAARSPGTTATVYLSRKWTGQPVAALGAHFGGISGQAISAMFARVA